MFVGSFDGYVYALDENTGKLNWSKKLVDGIVYTSPTVAYDKVFVTAFETNSSHRGYAYALNKTTGETIWAIEVVGSGYPGYMHSSPAVVGGMVFYGCHWEYNWFPLVFPSFVCASSVIDGSTQWRTHVGGGSGVHLISSPSVILGSRVFIGSDDGYLYCLDYNSGSVLWMNATGGKIQSSPAFADNKVFVGSNDGKVYAFDIHGNVI